MDSTQNNAQPPSSYNTSSAPSGTQDTNNYAGVGSAPVGNQNSDLYAQIAGQDDVQVVKKKKPSLFMNLVAAYMRITLYIDSLKRTYERLFNVLGDIWALAIGLVYLSGILVLIFAVYNRLQLPIYLEDQMQARNIQFESADYTMDRIVVHNLKDKNGAYTVETLVIYSTFADLLQKRIRLVAVDGLNIFLDSNSDFNFIHDVPQILSQIANPTQGGMDLSINALTINNALLTFQNNQLQIPLKFSMEGSYNNRTQVIMQLLIKQPNLQANALLTISDESGIPEWVLNVSNGTITLPRSSPEDLSGQFKMTLNKNEMRTLKADFKIGYGTIQKHIVASFDKQEGDDLSGSIIWEKENETEPELSSRVSFGLQHLKLEKDGLISSEGVMKIEADKLNTSMLSLSKLKTDLNTTFQCQNWTQCHFTITEPSSVSIQDLWLQYQRQEIQSENPVQFKLQPKPNAFVLNDDDPYLSFNLELTDLVFEGSIERQDQNMDIGAKRLSLAGSFSDAGTDASRLAINATGLDYASTGLSFKNAQLSIANLFQDSSQIQLQSQQTQLLGVPLLSQPFDLTLNMVGSKAKAYLTFREAPLVLNLEGQLALGQKTFVGNVRMNPASLSDFSKPVQEFWPDIPSSFSNFSGEIAVAGQINWRGTHAIGGPLSLGLKNVSFDIGQTQVRGLNTVLVLEALSPLLTKQNQHAVIESVKGIIPFQDFDVNFQLDNQTIRLNQFAVMGAGIPLSLPASVISTKSSNLLMYLKNDAPIEPEQFNRIFNLGGMQVAAGSANLSIPLEIQNGTLDTSNVTLKMTNVLLKRGNDAYAAVFDKAQNYFIRSGQIIMDKNAILQIALNGRLLPSKTPKDVQFNNVHLPEDFYRPQNKKVLPADIQKRLQILFGN